MTTEHLHSLILHLPAWMAGSCLTGSRKGLPGSRYSPKVVRAGLRPPLMLYCWRRPYPRLPGHGYTDARFSPAQRPSASSGSCKSSARHPQSQHCTPRPQTGKFSVRKQDARFGFEDYRFRFQQAGRVRSHDTPYYVAPEVLTTKHKETHGYAKSCDLWSLGVIIFMILSGRPPFYNSEFSGDITPGMSSRICAAQYDFQGEEWDAMSGPAKDLVRRLLKSDPKSRLTADEVLSHPGYQ